ncbi:MAG: hypothetical protein A3D65_01000 [Candidatus Lloydbacteria bacterium RIFCSPHIGHO2_02_FULL_50_13]|uniref:Uncharacterized protein n=1 Tax=Candidatus Lloydbacteria bacterium RIFCSPHIGHO2_02_FULL_50_13 TaxID=1798661 RepID=A0A1G2D3S7_9BACT|nr:MAG: hypothetical protein A3D65_01000 [Candidatus Lloydbacteria bacterium RIFCSPHIGHO2_02_FULL_50_13]
MSLEGVKSHEELAGELLALQRGENKGRGVPCVQDIAQYWKVGEIESARAIAWHDNDKIRDNHPDIQRWLEDNLFGPDVDSPLKVAERIKNWGRQEDH